MINIVINQTNYLVKENLSILEACKFVGVKIPRFCYHESLSIAGNCRLCLVKLETDDDKLLLACLTEVMPNMEIVSDDPIVEKAREEIIEFLLLDHPLDCPICDQGGECDLQDQSKKFGSFYNKFFFNKNSVEDKNFNVFIKTVMTRCIHCTRCVRFSSEIAGVEAFGTLNRGNSTEIGNYLNNNIFNSEISGNVIDLCPVGALTSKPYAFKNRPWELETVESIDLNDSLGSNVFVNFNENSISRVMPKYNIELNENIITDKARFSYDSVDSVNLLTQINKVNDSKKTALKNYSILKDYANFLNEKHLFVVSDNLSYEALSILKSASYVNPNIVLGSADFSTQKNKKNLFLGLNNNYSRVSKSNETCFLVSLNPRTELSLLNARLRFLSFQSDFSFYGVSYKFDSLLPTTYINFSASNIIKLFEGKLKNYSKALIKSKNALFLAGFSVQERGFSISNLEAFIKQLNPSIIFLSVHNAANSAGSIFLNIAQLTKKNINVASNVSFLNCSETTALKNFFAAKKALSSFFWFSTHASKTIVRNGFEIPCRNTFQENGIYLNLEYRPQMSRKCFGNAVKAISFYTFLNHFFFNGSYSLEKNKYNSFLKEIVNNPSKFSESSIKNYLGFINAGFKVVNFKSKILNYPFKPRLLTPYVSNTLTENSNNMILASKEFFKRFNNFY